MPERDENTEAILGPWAGGFLRKLAAKGDSLYTERNYRQALVEFSTWTNDQKGGQIESAEMK